jgi:putative inorganic carbon (hco3(-)) transporter
MSFALFLVVNAMLFVRPAEFHPALYGEPVYEACILTCLLASYPAVIARISFRDLQSRPLNACVVGLLPAIVLSHLANGETTRAADNGIEFVKLLFYYFLLVGVVDTPSRLDRFLAALGVFAATITALAVLHYHKIVQVPAIEFLQTGLDDTGSLDHMVSRLGSTGLFQDPNDMSLMLVMAIVICLYEILERKRVYWVAPLALFGHALRMTYSRGGFLGLMAALTCLLLSRYGRKGVLLGAAALPAVVLLFAGRQSTISLTEGTGQGRIQLWLEGVILFVRHPIFGIGSDRYDEYAGHVAHNSFIHGYTELGVVGGTLFLSAFYLAVWPLIRLGDAKLPPVSPALGRMRAYVLAVVVGYGTGLLTLSNVYTIPTYTVLGLSSAYLAAVEREYGVAVLRVEGRLIRRLAVLSVAFVVASQIGVRILARVTE